MTYCFKKKRRRRLAPPKGDAHYRQLWRVVDGAVKDAFDKHPDYLTEKGVNRAAARNSVTKRVVGAVMGYAEQSVQGRSGYSSAVDTEAARPTG